MSVVAETATLVHDWTMADVTRCSRTAMAKHTRSAFLDEQDREAATWHAIVAELYSCGCGINPDYCTRIHPPTFVELLGAAMDALTDEVTAARHHGGWPAWGVEAPGERPGQDVEPHLAPRFKAYWLPVKYARTDGFSDRVCETLALRDALAVLTGEQYEAIATLAAFDNAVGEAAEALGLRYHGFYYRVSSAREKVKSAWFGEETPTTAHATGETCRVGHPRATHGRFRSADGVWECRACKRASERRRKARGRRIAGQPRPRATSCSSS